MTVETLDPIRSREGVGYYHEDGLCPPASNVLAEFAKADDVSVGNWLGKYRKCETFIRHTCTLYMQKECFFSIKLFRSFCPTFISWITKRDFTTKCVNHPWNHSHRNRDGMKMKIDA